MGLATCKVSARPFPKSKFCSDVCVGGEIGVVPRSVAVSNVQSPLGSKLSATMLYKKLEVS